MYKVINIAVHCRKFNVFLNPYNDIRKSFIAELILGASSSQSDVLT